ncbi:MAG: APC family permease [Gemmatimonadales bacterium]
MPHPELDRAIGPWHATAMVIGTMIGASIFVQPSIVIGHVPSLPGVFAVWLAAGVLTLCGALVCAELASAFPRTGGVYVFLAEAFSPALGFLWGWAMLWSIHSGILAAIAMVFARYVGYFAPLGDVGTRAVAIGVILVLSAVNYVGVRHGSRLQAAFTAGKLLAVVGLVVLGVVLGARLPAHFVGAATADAVTPQGFALALSAGLFAYGGWHLVTYAAGETVRPERTLPRAIIRGTLVVTACYLALNAVYLYVLPLDAVVASSRVAADAADAVLGVGGGAVMSGVVLFSTLGALGGVILTGPRVYFAMARDGLFVPWVAALHPRFRTPHRAIALQAVWSAALVATATYRTLFTQVIYTEWIFFGLMALGMMRLGRRPGYEPRYRVPGGLVIPCAFIAGAAGVVGVQLVSAPLRSLVGLLVVALGLPVYYWWARARPPRSLVP